MLTSSNNPYLPLLLRLVVSFCQNRLVVVLPSLQVHNNTNLLNIIPRYYNNLCVLKNLAHIPHMTPLQDNECDGTSKVAPTHTHTHRRFTNQSCVTCNFAFAFDTFLCHESVIS